MSKGKFDYEAEVAAAKAAKGSKITMAQVVRDNRADFEGFAKAGAELEFAIEKIADNVGCNRGSLRREFARQHLGWGEFRKRLADTTRSTNVWTETSFGEEDSRHG